MGAAFWHRDGDDLIIELRVIPRARRTESAGLREDRLCIRLQAPPVEGKANRALLLWIAEQFGVVRSAVTLERGERNRDKRVRVRGVTEMPASLRE